MDIVIVLLMILILASMGGIYDQLVRIVSELKQLNRSAR